MHRLLWVLQIVFGLYFIVIGVLHFIVPEGLPDAMAWMYELSDGLHWASGIAEILGGLGLILPGLTGIRPELTIWAAIGLALVMVGAAIWHAGRDGEAFNIFLNLANAGVMLFIAWGRARRAPLTPKAAA